MFCVVLGHFVEGISGAEGLYLVLYLFHMPAFVFLSGYFARFRPGASLKRLMLPYLVFQAVYITFARVVLGSGEPYPLTVPYWLLWYLPALFIWGLLLPAIDTDRPGRMAAVLLGLVGLALAAGFDGSINRSMTLSRALVYFPYFAAGVYARKTGLRAPPGGWSWPGRPAGRSFPPGWRCGGTCRGRCFTVAPLTRRPGEGRSCGCSSTWPGPAGSR